MDGPRFTPRQMIDRLIAYDTTSRNSNLALIEDVKAYLEAWGATVELVPNEDGTKANLFATLGPDREGGVVLSGHTDVVPVDGQDWHTDPWTVTEKDGRLYGRGTCDMKSFSAVALAMVPEFVAAGLERPLHFALSYDEEVGCVGVHGLIRQLSERPGFRPRAVLVGEPTEMRVVSAHKGIRSFRTTVTGLEFHSSQTHKGVSAILAAARLISYLDILGGEMRERGDPTGKFDPPYTSVQVGTIEGGTAVNIIPKTCSFEWEYRPLPDQDPDEIIERFETYARDEVLSRMRSVSPDCAVETVALANAPGLRVEEGSSAETLAMALAERNDTEAVAFATEGGLFQEIGLPTVVCGPGSIQQAHKPNEFIEISQIEACEAFMRRLAADLAR